MSKSEKINIIVFKSPKKRAKVYKSVSDSERIRLIDSVNKNNYHTGGCQGRKN